MTEDNYRLRDEDPLILCLMFGAIACLVGGAYVTILHLIALGYFLADLMQCV